MADLTFEEQKFLEYHNVPLSRVLDAEQMAPSYYRAFMSAHEMWIAYGVTPCKAAGHTMRTRVGHCVQCKPANLGFLARYDNPGEIYIAYSYWEGIVKVGSASDAAARVGSLNTHSYGEIMDWLLLFRRECLRANRIEYLVHAALSSHRVIRSYSAGGHVIKCRELFQCDPKFAINAVERVLGQEGKRGRR